jgi:hypothetical protein
LSRRHPYPVSNPHQKTKLQTDDNSSESQHCRVTVQWDDGEIDEIETGRLLLFDNSQLGEYCFICFFYRCQFAFPLIEICKFFLSLPILQTFYNHNQPISVLICYHSIITTNGHGKTYLGIEHDATCAGCDTNNSIKGMRWKCSECPNFDLCTLCYMAAKDDHAGHKFQRITEPTERY